MPPTVLLTGLQGGGGLLVAALNFASFSVLVGLGPDAVITMWTGKRGLSIPAVMTLRGRCRSSS
jgi:ribose transport system permease protein